MPETTESDGPETTESLESDCPADSESSPTAALAA
jgi:hypothetical protein